MGRPREGGIRKVNGRFEIRVQYRDAQGVSHNERRYATTKQEAIEVRQKLLTEIAETDKVVDYNRRLFSDFADWFKEKYLFPAVYRDGRKIAGRRAPRPAVSQLKVLVEHLGKKKLGAIRYHDLERFRLTRLGMDSKRNPKDAKVKTKVSITTVNRELQLLRRMLNTAKRQGWIRENPFSQGDALMSQADEVRRTRVLSREEEHRLLKACYGSRAHLKSIIIMALDTGMRSGEIFKLKWGDVDLERRTISIQASTTKTLTSRTVPITERLKVELEKITFRPAGDLVFHQTTIKRAFGTARVMAGLEDLRFHDLRHTAGTRLALMGMGLVQIGQILGHTNPKTTLRYTNVTQDVISQAAGLLNQWTEQDSEQLDSELMV